MATVTSTGGGAGNVLNALDFFGKDDPEGIEKFKTVAFRALHEQKIDEELRQTKQENGRLHAENMQLAKEVRDLQASLTANIDDRERVLAFKSKRIDELNTKLREYEAINASLLQTLNGGNVATTTYESDGSNGSMAAAGTRAAMISLINSGKPLFHALESCKEQEYKRLYNEKRLQYEQLLQETLTNEALAREMRFYQTQKQETDAQIQQLEAKITAITAEKDQKLHTMERKLVMEHERLRKEKETELHACQESMEKQMRMQLDTTTHRTIEENERVQLELRYQSAQLEKLVKQVDQHKNEARQAQQEQKIFEDMNVALSRKIKFYEQLFAKMQLKDRTKTNALTPTNPEFGHLQEHHRLRAPRKPPLPSLGSPRAASTVSSALSPLFSPVSALDQDEEDNYFDGGNNNDIDIDTAGDQLNAITGVLEQHLQRREFTKKQVDAVLRYHRSHYQQRAYMLRSGEASSGGKPSLCGQSPVVKKKIMLSKDCYSPSNFRRGRKILQAPMTLDALIRESAAKAPHSPRRRKQSGLDESVNSTALPSLSSPTSTLERDMSDMWKASPANTQIPHTARF